MTDDKLMHIGEVAERVGLSLRTLRHYDDIDLVKPSGRTEGGFRLYSEADVERLVLIRNMKPMGYSLERMAELLAVIDARAAGVAEDRGAEAGHASDTAGGEAAALGVEEAENALEGFRVDARERRDRLAMQLAKADEFLAMLDEV